MISPRTTRTMRLERRRSVPQHTNVTRLASRSRNRPSICLTCTYQLPRFPSNLDLRSGRYAPFFRGNIGKPTSCSKGHNGVGSVNFGTSVCSSGYSAGSVYLFPYAVLETSFKIILTGLVTYRGTKHAAGSSTRWNIEYSHIVNVNRHCFKQRACNEQ